jgi:hypothetical protein
MWEWISIAIGLAVVGLYAFALKQGRAQTRDRLDREEKASDLPPPGE